MLAAVHQEEDPATMKLLRLSPHLTLPHRVVTEKIGILGATGSGKTTTASVLVEELLRQQLPVDIIDPTDAWWGLRSSKDGKAEGFPVTVLGGDHGDVPLEETAGAVIADLIAEQAPPLVISLAHFTKGAMRRFLADFAERLYLKNRRALHLVWDEADEAAPQNPQKMKGGERLFGAVDQIVRRGRIRGLGVTMISQRSAEISKSILSQCSVLIAHRSSHPTDLDPIFDWMKANARDRMDEVRETIAKLKNGEAWVMSPELLGVFDRYTIRDRETFNSSATPAPGEEAVVPRRLAKPDLALLQEKMKDTIERAKANDPAALRRTVAEKDRRIVELERHLANKPAPAPAKIERVEVPVVKDAQVKRLESAAARLVKAAELAAAAAQDLRPGLAAAAASRPAPAQRQATPAPAARATGALGHLAVAPRAPRDAAGEPGGSIAVGNSGLRRMLIALAQRPQGLTNQQLGVRAGVSSRSGTFSTYLGRARSQGWVDGRGTVRITDSGLAALGSYDPLPEGRELADYWIRELGGGAARMLQSLVEAYPGSLTNEQLGERAQISHASGTFSTYLGRLRALELVTGRGDLRASEELA